MKILVIDDQKEQREYAVQSLLGHEVVLADGWREGEKAIEAGGWDMVLTDLSMPAIGEGQSDSSFVGKPTPYGFILAMLALKAGIPKVAIVSNGQSDGNHHSHPIFWAADSVHGQIIPGRLWAFVGYDCPHMDNKKLPDMEKPWVLKDWADVVSKILAGWEGEESRY